MRLRMHSAVFFQGAQRLRSVVGAVASCTVQVTRKLFQSALPEASEKKTLLECENTRFYTLPLARPAIVCTKFSWGAKIEGRRA